MRDGSVSPIFLSMPFRFHVAPWDMVNPFPNKEEVEKGEEEVEEEEEESTGAGEGDIGGNEEDDESRGGGGRGTLAAPGVRA
jgi:hypothetical protein